MEHIESAPAASRSHGMLAVLCRARCQALAWTAPQRCAGALQSLHMANLHACWAW